MVAGNAAANGATVINSNSATSSGTPLYSGVTANSYANSNNVPGAPGSASSAGNAQTAQTSTPSSSGTSSTSSSQSQTAGMVLIRCHLQSAAGLAQTAMSWQIGTLICCAHCLYIERNLRLAAVSCHPCLSLLLRTVQEGIAENCSSTFER